MSAHVTAPPSSATWRSALTTLRGRRASTPQRLRLAAALLMLVVLGFGVAAFDDVATRRQAAQAAYSQTEPLLIEAEGLYASLSDADATAATTFVTGGLEPAARRQRYVFDLRDAARELATLARQVGSAQAAQQAVLTISTQLPVYGGLVETARAENRQGFPVGAAYLRQASALMRAQILPAASRLYEAQARRLESNYASGVSRTAIIVFLVLALIMLALLVLIQLHLARITHRVFSVPLGVATVVGLTLTVWGTVALISEQSALARAQRRGSDAVQLLAAARVLVLRAQADESLALVARGGDTQDLADFTTAVGLIARPAAQGGLLAQAAAIVRRDGSAGGIDLLSADLGRYTATHQQVATLETSGLFPAAVKLAVGSTATELAIADRLNTGLATQIDAAQVRFRRAAGSAGAATDGLKLALPLLTLVAALLTLYALQRRIGEYR